MTRQWEGGGDKLPPDEPWWQVALGFILIWGMMWGLAALYNWRCSW